MNFIFLEVDLKNREKEENFFDCQTNRSSARKGEEKKVVQIAAPAFEKIEKEREREKGLKR